MPRSPRARTWRSRSRRAARPRAPSAGPTGSPPAPRCRRPDTARARPAGGEGGSDKHEDPLAPDRPIVSGPASGFPTGSGTEPVHLPLRRSGRSGHVVIASKATTRPPRKDLRAEMSASCPRSEVVSASGLRNTIAAICSPSRSPTCWRTAPSGAASSGSQRPAQPGRGARERGRPSRRLLGTVVLVTAGGSLDSRTLRRRLGWSKANATEVVDTLESRGPSPAAGSLTTGAPPRST